MSSAQPAAPAASTGSPSTPARLALRLVLALGVTLTLVGVVCLAIILGAYFTDADPVPALYAGALWGLPAGFLLMVAHLLSLSAISRRARRRRHG